MFIKGSGGVQPKNNDKRTINVISSDPGMPNTLSRFV